MASSDFKTELVRDSRLDIKEEIVYNVRSGPSQSTYQSYTANSASPTNVTFTVQAPSESVVMDRNILIQATCSFEIVITLAADAGDLPDNLVATQPVFRYGITDGFQSFPFSHLIETASATINNASVSINSSDVLPALLRYIPKNKLNQYNNMTPTYLDNYKNFSDCASYNIDDPSAQNSPLNGYIDGLDSENLPRGCHPLVNYVLTTAAPVTVAAVLAKTYTIRFNATFTEPLFLSPFIFSGQSEHPAGILGLNQFNLNLNLNADCTRSWCTALKYNTGAGNLYSCKLTGISGAKLLVNYLSLQPTQVIASKNVVDYCEYTRYVTTPNNTAAIAANGTSEIVLQNVQLSQIPDLILLYARDSVSSYRISETFLPIEKISCNFNNVSGILSSASQQQLFRMSKAAGCNMNWYEWSGYSYSGVRGDADVTGVGSDISTVGAVLAIDPSSDLCLDAMHSCGSSGQYNLQVNVTVRNNGAALMTPQVVMITVNSGLFVLNQGTAAIYRGLLTMETVLKASEEDRYKSSNHDDNQRLIGDGFKKKGMGRSGGMRQSKLHSFV